MRRGGKPGVMAPHAPAPVLCTPQSCSMLLTAWRWQQCVCGFGVCEKHSSSLHSGFILGSALAGALPLHLPGSCLPHACCLHNMTRLPCLFHRSPTPPQWHVCCAKRRPPSPASLTASSCGASSGLRALRHVRPASGMWTWIRGWPALWGRHPAVRPPPAVRAPLRRARARLLRSQHARTAACLWMIPRWGSCARCHGRDGEHSLHRVVGMRG